MTQLSVTKNFNGDVEKMGQGNKEISWTCPYKIGKQNEKYCKKANKLQKPITFKEGDLVWIHLGKERFPSKRSSKLKLQANRHFKVLQWIGQNAYKIELLGDYGVWATFNVFDLSPYYWDQEDWVDLGASPFQPEESDTRVSQVPTSPS